MKYPFCSRICIFLFLFSASLFVVYAGNYTINANGSDTGRIYEGIGAVSAGGNSRLLIDYPEPQRSQVLDYLFKPKFGASFQHLKVEIGSGQNSTSGAVASHAYSDAEIANPVSRSYEFWLLKEAKNRNPDVILDCLGWGFPKCVDGKWTPDMAEYIASFVDLAKTEWSVDMDWVGGCINDKIDAYVDGIRVCTVVDTQRVSGNACIGGSFDANQYDNLSVKSTGGQWDVVNQSDPSVSFTGTWWYYAGSWYMFGDTQYTDITDSSATYPFYGRIGRIWGALREDCGYMDVYVDNVYETAIDCYSPSGIYGMVLYETDELPLGNHTLKAVVTGQKNASSSNELVILEAFSSSQSLMCTGPPESLSLQATATASSVWNSDSTYGADKANDGDYTTRWNSAAGDVAGAWLEMDFGTSKTFSSTRLTGIYDRIQSYKIQYYDGTWKDAFVGTTVGDSKVDVFAAVTGTRARLLVTSATTVPSLFEFEIYETAGDWDLNADGLIDISDLAIFCSQWLSNDCGRFCDCGGADLFHDDQVDLCDYNIFSGSSI